jgi:hypothetical protein
MTAPKHLWSGDWERESAARARELADGGAPVAAPEPAVPAAPPEPVAAPPPPPPPPPPSSPPRREPPRRPTPRGRRLPPRIIALAVLAALLVAGAAYGASALIGSGGGTGPSPIPAATSTSVDWLGVQLEGLATGGVVIATVAPGGPADQAGLEPGDVIAEIDGKPIRASGDVEKAVAGLHAGDSIEIQVSRGSTIYTTRATLASRPGPSP